MQTMSSRRYDVEELTDLLKQEANISRVLRDLYGGDAVFDRSSQSYRLADIRGGQDQSCQITTSGRYAGRVVD